MVVITAETDLTEETPSGAYACRKPARIADCLPVALSLGVCCMASKLNSKPMQAILRRLKLCGNFNIMAFSEEMILMQPASSWPIVQCLIAFDSSGFPLDKCIEYCKLVHPKCINNVEAQLIFRSRTAVYRMLQDWCIPCPEHIIVDHANMRGNELVEDENYVELNGKIIHKPFVEKPDDGDRHDIWIYYPRNIGGGARKLFRKVKDQSSSFDPNQNTIRRDGIYVYEPFLPTQGTDIKVYTVGASYVHAEARRAPTIDGKVQRTKDGKEERYPVVLTQGEKAIAAFIVKAFRQNVCGFDILRTDGGSYVCDVNGWSFVKGHKTYYNDCSALLRKHLLEECGVCTGPPNPLVLEEDAVSVEPESEPVPAFNMSDSLIGASPELLRSVIVIMRHGDRRPKEKMKLKTQHSGILAYFDSTDKGKVRLTTPEEMETLRGHMEEACTELRVLISAHEGRSSPMITSDDHPGSQTMGSEGFLKPLHEELMNVELLIQVLNIEDRFSGLEKKVQLTAVKWKPRKDDHPRRAAQVLIVAKWGGELTVSGVMQAQTLGRRMRVDLYPNDPTGLLRLHSSFRHDFKIYSSQEGRCQITAAAFTKGFLDLEGDLIPILASLVTRDKFAQDLLDEPIPKRHRDAVKQKIEALLLSYDEMNTPATLQKATPTQHAGLLEAARRIGSPLQLLHTIRSLTNEYIDSIAAAKVMTFRDTTKRSDQDSGALDLDEAHENSVLLGKKVLLGTGPAIPFDFKDSYTRKWLSRWRKVYHNFAQLKDEHKGYSNDNVFFDTSQITHIWNNLYYDMLTHRQYLDRESCRIAEMLVGLVHPLNEWVSLSEYGISQKEKIMTGVKMTWRLLGKMLGDLEFMIEEDAGVDEAGRCRSKIVSNGLQPCKGSEFMAASVNAQEPEPNEVLQQIEQPKPLGRLPKLTNEVQDQLKRAMRDSSDWHPRLNAHVAENTDLKNTRMVRSRIYVTSASTMQCLFNMLREFQATGSSKIKSQILDQVMDPNCLSHLVFRCYERQDDETEEQVAAANDQKSRERARYRLEIAMSPGVQVFKDGRHVPWPEGADLKPDKAQVAPLQILVNSAELSRFERFITDAIKEYAVEQQSDEEEGDSGPSFTLV